MTNGQPISIILSPAQVDQIVRAAAEGSTPGFSTLNSTTLMARAAQARSYSDALGPDAERNGAQVLAPPSEQPPPPVDGDGQDVPITGSGYMPEYSDTRLSRSLLRGLSILTCFGPGREERGILELAGELGMSPSTTHRYVATLVELGLLERCPRSRKYRLATI
jgi:hypothetical protein